MRRKLREIEKGVCQICKLDCIRLVSSLRAVRAEGDDYEATLEQRRQILSKYSERFFLRGYKTLCEKLIRQPLEGNAWEADHIVPVFLGGGCSGLQNMRTLCVCCHRDVTLQQAKFRVEQRRGEGSAGPSVERKRRAPLKLKRAPRLRAKYISDSD